MRPILNVLMSSSLCLMLTASGPAVSASRRHESTRTKEPERPIPAEQWTTAGPALSLSRLPDSRTAPRNSRKVSGQLGTPKSGQVV